MKKILLSFVLALCIWAPSLSTVVAQGNSFKANHLFPNWDTKKPTGVIGKNGTGDLGSLAERGKETQGLLMFLPKIINYTLFAVAAVVILVLIYAGIKLLIAQGSDENKEKSKSVFQYAIIGFLFAISAYTIVRVVYEILIDAK